MRNTDHLVHQAKCGCNFRRSGQKRNDPDHFLLYAASWYEDRKRSPSRRTKEKERGERAKEISSLANCRRTCALQNTDCL
jgi:hypothetical protein